MTDDQIRTILVALAEIRGDVKAVRSENHKADQLHRDFEVRLRALERVRWAVAGAFAVAGSGLGALVTSLLR